MQLHKYFTEKSNACSYWCERACIIRLHSFVLTARRQQSVRLHPQPAVHKSGDALEYIICAQLLTSAAPCNMNYHTIWYRCSVRANNGDDLLWLTRANFDSRIKPRSKWRGACAHHSRAHTEAAIGCTWGMICGNYCYVCIDNENDPSWMHFQLVPGVFHIMLSSLVHIHEWAAHAPSEIARRPYSVVESGEWCWRRSFCSTAPFLHGNESPAPAGKSGATTYGGIQGNGGQGLTRVPKENHFGTRSEK